MGEETVLECVPVPSDDAGCVTAPCLCAMVHVAAVSGEWGECWWLHHDSVGVVVDANGCGVAVEEITSDFCVEPVAVDLESAANVFASVDAGEGGEEDVGALCVGADVSSRLCGDVEECSSVVGDHVVGAVECGCVTRLVCTVAEVEEDGLSGGKFLIWCEGDSDVDDSVLCDVDSASGCVM